jgi:phosphoribosylglycinamide formyltransferase-1
MSNIAILASGSGTNAENIIKYFSTRNTAKVCLVMSNNPNALVLTRAETLGVTTVFFDRRDFYDSGVVLNRLISDKIDFIVLAGFLWLVPETILEKYKGRIVNIHPALLPDYGGKGMYGDAVHRAVIKSGDKESGITIHFVDNHYDQGDIIFQERCAVDPSDTPESLAGKIHSLEYAHFPPVIEEVIMKLTF